MLPASMQLACPLRRMVDDAHRPPRGAMPGKRLAASPHGLAARTVAKPQLHQVMMAAAGQCGVRTPGAAAVLHAQAGEAAGQSLQHHRRGMDIKPAHVEALHAGQRPGERRGGREALDIGQAFKRWWSTTQPHVERVGRSCQQDQQPARGAWGGMGRGAGRVGRGRARGRRGRVGRGWGLRGGGGQQAMDGCPTWIRHFPQGAGAAAPRPQAAPSIHARVHTWRTCRQVKIIMIEKPVW